MERDPMDLVRAWMFDLHMAGREISYRAKQAVEAAAAKALNDGGSLTDVFAAARRVL